MPRLSKNPRSQGVEPSPTPMIGTAGDSSTVISTPLGRSALARIIAAIQPAVPPPTMTSLRMVDAGPAAPSERTGATDPNDPNEYVRLVCVPE
jgi:hypothetical protein